VGRTEVKKPSNRAIFMLHKSGRMCYHPAAFFMPDDARHSMTPPVRSDRCPQAPIKAAGCASLHENTEPCIATVLFRFLYKESPMMRLLTMLLVAAFALSVAGSSWAADEATKKEGGEKKPAAKKMTPEERFKRMDKDGDGKLSFDEFKGRATKEETIKEREKQFAEMDKDKDKAVTLEEMKAYAKEKAKEKKPAKKKE